MEIVTYARHALSYASKSMNLRGDTLGAICSLVGYSAVHGKKPLSKFFVKFSEILCIVPEVIYKHFNELLDILYEQCTKLVWLRDVRRAKLFTYLRQFLK